MRVLLEEVVLDLPDVVVPERVHELDLIEGVLQQLVLAVRTPRPRELVLVEEPELHWAGAGALATRCRKRVIASVIASGSSIGKQWVASSNSTSSLSGSTS